jgi:hypothetical protein
MGRRRRIERGTSLCARKAGLVSNVGEVVKNGAIEMQDPGENHLLDQVPVTPSIANIHKASSMSS